MKHIKKQRRLDSVEAYAACVCATTTCSCPECVCNCSCSPWYLNAGVYEETDDDVNCNNTVLISINHDSDARRFL